MSQKLSGESLGLVLTYPPPILLCRPLGSENQLHRIAVL